MQIIEAKRQIETNATNTATAFTIEANSKAFQILSSNLYQNKPLAIVRELACNAYDSHVAAGKADEPFEIILPSEMRPELRVRDHGTGLSRDQITTLYTTYFGSDKRQSNDLIGGLGLGSKSPFAYTDSFTIESRHNGKLMTFVAYLGDGGTPMIREIAESNTAQQNGVEIIVPVTPKDFTQFRVAAESVLKWFDVIPRVTGTTVKAPEIDISHEDFFLFRNVSDGNGLYVLMGNVCYKVDRSNLPGEMTQKYKNNVLKSYYMDYSIVLKMKIGEADVAASRETLSLDKTTLRNIDRKLSLVVKELAKVVQKEFMSKPTLWEAARFMTQLPFNINVKDVWPHNDKWMYPSVGHATIRRVKEHTWGNKRVTYIHQTPSAISLQALSNPFFVLVTKDYPLENFLRANQNKLSRYETILLRGEQGDFLDLFHAIGHDRWVFDHELTIPEKVVRPRSYSKSSKAKSKTVSEYKLRVWHPNYTYASYYQSPHLVKSLKEDSEVRDILLDDAGQAQFAAYAITRDGTLTKNSADDETNDLIRSYWTAIQGKKILLVPVSMSRVVKSLEIPYIEQYLKDKQAEYTAYTATEAYDWDHQQFAASRALTNNNYNRSLHEGTLAWIKARNNSVLSIFADIILADRSSRENWTYKQASLTFPSRHPAIDGLMEYIDDEYPLLKGAFEYRVADQDIKRYIQLEDNCNE